MHNGKATVSLLKAMGTIEEWIRVAREHKSVEVKLYNGDKLISTKKYTGNTIKISN